MAQQDIYGMFGSVTPDQAQAAYLNQFMVPQNTLAQLNPYQQVAALVGQGAAQAGAGLGRLFGGKTSMEIEQAQMQDIMSQVSDVQDPAERLSKAAQLFRQRGMEDKAMALESESERMLGLQATRKAKTAEATAKEFEVQREKDLQKELEKLPANASSQELMAVYRKYVSADKGIAAAQAEETARANREARMEELKFRTEQRTQDLQMQLENKLQVAQMQGANAQQLAAIQQQGQQQLQAMKAQSDIQIAQMKLEGEREKAATKAALAKQNAPKDVAEADIDVATIEMGMNRGKEIISMLEDPKNKGLMTRQNRAMQAATGVFGGGDTEQRQKIDDVETFLNSEVNALLLMAKGVQTEGDAQRAKNQILTEAAKGNNSDYVNAFKRMNEWKQQIVNLKKNYIKRRGFGDSAPSEGTKENPIKLD